MSHSQPLTQAGPPPQAARASRGAPVTILLIAVNIGIFALEELWGGSTRSSTLVRMGAVFKGAPEPLSWLSTVSYGYLHIGVLHLGMNMLGLWSMGRALESMLGSARFFALYALSGLGGGIAISTASDAHVTAGASGALFGLLGAACGPLIARYRAAFFDAERRQIRSILGQILLPNVLISLLPGVSFLGHLGGFLVGALFAARMLLRRGGGKKPVQPATGSLGLTVFALLLAALTVASLGLIWSAYEPWAPSPELS